MKKLLLFAVLLSVMGFASAQSISLYSEGNHYVNGDTIDMLAFGDELVFSPMVHNDANSDVTVKAICESVSGEGMSVMGICAGACVSGNESGEFTIAANTNYGELFNVDFEIEDNATNSVFCLRIYNVQDASDETRIYIRIARYTEGIDDVQMSQMVAFPNPANNMLNVRCEGVEDATVVLCNVMGQTVRSAKLNGNATQMNVADLPAGVYFYGIEQNGVRYAMKKVVVR